MVRHSCLNTDKDLLQRHQYFGIPHRSMFVQQQFDKCMMGSVKDTEHSPSLSAPLITQSLEMRNQTHGDKHDR